MLETTEVTHLSGTLFDFSKTPDSRVSAKVMTIEHHFEKYFSVPLKCVTSVSVNRYPPGGGGVGPRS